jgi:hypothetical protein
LVGNRLTSPTKAMIFAATIGPTPKMSVRVVPEAYRFCSVRRHREPEGLVVADGPVEVADQYHQMIQNGSTPRAPNKCPRVRLIEVTSVLSPVASTPPVR